MSSLKCDAKVIIILKKTKKTSLFFEVVILKKYKGMIYKLLWVDFLRFFILRFIFVPE